MNSTETPKPPIKSGWRGNLNGYLENSNSSQIRVSQINVTLDSDLAWALCNILCDSSLDCLHGSVDEDQHKSLSTLGAALGRLIDHPSANNGGRELVK